jgi:putative membrane protein
MQLSKFKAVQPITFAVTLAALLIGCASNRQAGLGGYAQAVQTGRSSGNSNADSDFAHTACQASAAEIELGKLAALNTKNKAIRAFAQRISDDHAKVEKELDQLFSQKQIASVTELADELQVPLDRLARLKGGEFDAAFKKQVIENHERAISAYEQQASHGTDPDLKAFAQKYLPELRDHLSVAQSLPISSDKDGPAPEMNFSRGLSTPALRGVGR